MATLIQKFQFSLAKKQILSPKSDKNIKYDLARNLARTHSDQFIADPMLLSFLYESIKSQETIELASDVLFELFHRLPKRSIAQKNLMVTIRRMAIDGNNEIAQKAAEILIDRNEPKTCLASKYFMEMIECLASFDEDGTVTRMLDQFEEKAPLDAEKSESFAQARANNIESLTKQDPDVDIDLIELETRDGKPAESVMQGSDDDATVGMSNLWAVPVQSQDN